MLVSIIIANYNNESFIQQTINSVINQTYRDIETIIVDDCSTDNSCKIIESSLSNFKKVKFLKLENNVGGGFAKEIGINESKGELICFLDSDDFLQPTAIEKVVNIHKKNDKLSLVYTGATKINKLNEELGLLGYSKDIKNSTALESDGIFHLACWKSKFYNNLKDKFNPHFFIAYDIDLYYKLEEVGEVFFLDEPLYYYRIHANNISLDKSRLGYSIAEMIIAKYDAQKRRNSVDMKKLGLILNNYLLPRKRKTFLSKILKIMNISIIK
jgi:glycosyltransferase involved in cell wall biosynthesis